MTQLYSRENTPSCMADKEALVLAKIIMDHLVNIQHLQRYQR